MNRTLCPRCGTEIKESSSPSFCTNCGAQINVIDPSIEQYNKEDAPNQATNRTSKVKSFITLILVIAAFIFGLFTPKFFADSGNEIVINMSKSQLIGFFSSVDDQDVTETDLMFKGVQSKLVEKESEETPGIYEVTGEFTYDQITYTFIQEVLLYDSIYFSYGLPDFEE